VSTKCHIGGFQNLGQNFNLITVFIKKEQNFLGVFQNSKQIHMPKRSDREAFLIELNDILRILAMYNEEHTESFKELYDVYVGIQLSRYMNPRNVIPKSRSLMDLLLAYEDHQFKVIARMTKSSFLAVLNMIESNPVFHNDSRHPQAPVSLQLIVFLNRLGFDGNGASVNRNAIFCGVSVGAVDMYCNRCIIAIEQLIQKYVTWPDFQERKQISQRFGAKYGIPNCVGIVDGTPINMADKPKIDGEVYWSSKCRYCINLQLVCDDKKFIRFFQTGWPGSVFDSVVFDNSTVCKTPHLYFCNNEFLIADSGYAAKSFIVTPYKQPLASLPHNELFNTLFSSARCIIEHVNGILKARFQCLKGMRVKIIKLTDFDKLNRWILCCIILHNILNDFNDLWEEEECERDEQYEDDIRRIVNENSNVIDMRLKIQSILLQWYYNSKC
jgi:hypothetical protein